jgi:hypothetical protein
VKTYGVRQKIGHLLGALAQQALLAGLIRDEGDRPGAVALATEVNRWLVSSNSSGWQARLPNS